MKICILVFLTIIIGGVMFKPNQNPIRPDFSPSAEKEMKQGDNELINGVIDVLNGKHPLSRPVSAGLKQYQVEH